MNHLGTGLLVTGCLAALIAALCVGCARQKPQSSDDPGAVQTPGGGQILPPWKKEEPVCGGTTDSTDPNAPKTVASDEITDFLCEVSLLSVDLRENPVLLMPKYGFSARKEGDGVQCTRRMVDQEETFTPSDSFLAELQEIISRYDLAQFNGVSRKTHGLPDNFGAELRVTYASGESIYAYNNQNMFLPLSAVEELARLFYRNTYLSISMTKAVDLMSAMEEYRIVDVRRQDEYDGGHIPGAICVPNESIQVGDTGVLTDKEEILFVYCRSGRRSKEAARKLAEMGYVNVYEFGGIIDWHGGLETE